MEEKDIALERTIVEEEAFTEEVLRDLRERVQDPIIIIRPGNSVKLSFQQNNHQITNEQLDPDMAGRVLRVFSANVANPNDGKIVSSITIYGSNPREKIIFQPDGGNFLLVISYPGN